MRKKLYGERDASVEFGDLFAGVFMQLGFERCPQQPQFYLHRSGKVLADIHQDDVHAAGPDLELVKMMRNVSERIRMKWSELLKVGCRYAFLKNYRTITRDGVFLTANPKYGEDIIKRLGMEGANPTATPIAKGRLPSDAEEPIREPDRVTEFRHCVAVARFLRNYRPDLGYTVKELCHGLQTPTEADWERLRRLARYLRGSGDIGVDFKKEEQGGELIVSVYTDTDWAGDKVSRKSTSSFVIFAKGCLLYDGARTQTVLAQSSGESEVYGAASGVSPGVLVHGMLEWMGMRPGPLQLHLDSKAAKAIISRIGVGGVRHLEVKCVWLQSLAKMGRLKVFKVPGEANGADLNTKVHPRARFEYLCRLIGLRRCCVDGVPESDVKTVESEQGVRRSAGGLELGLHALAVAARAFASHILSGRRSDG